MDDKETTSEGQEETQVDSPEVEESPEVVDEKSSPTEEVDKDLSDYASNKGYSEEDLKDEKLSKALKIGMNAEKQIGKSTPKQEKPVDGDMDSYFKEILGDEATPQDAKNLVEATSDVDISKLSPEERRAFEFIKAEAKKAALDEIAPIKSQLQRQHMRSQYLGLEKEYGDDFTKNAKEILVKVRDNPGTSLDDATKSVLLDKLLKKQLTKGVQQGKEIKAKEISEKTEAVKKTETKTLTDEWQDLSLAEQEKILKDLQEKG